MDFVKKFWPFSFKEKKEVKDLVIAVIIYVAASIVCNIVCGLLGRIPVIGWLFSLIAWVFSLYCTAGVVFTFLNYFNVGPFASKKEE